MWMFGEVFRDIPCQFNRLYAFTRNTPLDGISPTAELSKQQKFESRNTFIWFLSIYYFIKKQFYNILSIKYTKNITNSDFNKIIYVYELTKVNL